MHPQPQCNAAHTAAGCVAPLWLGPLALLLTFKPFDDLPRLCACLKKSDSLKGTHLISRGTIDAVLSCLVVGKRMFAGGEPV
jgi:hypothetical protein